MSLRDQAMKIIDKSRTYAAEHEDTLAGGIEQAENLVNKQTSGRYRNRIAQAGGKMQAYIEELPRANSENEAHNMTRNVNAEPTVNDLRPMLAPGVENEPMLLLDTTGSMSYPVTENSTVQRRQVIGEAIGRIVEVMGAKDSQAAKEQAQGDDAGGLMTVTFAGGAAESIGDLSPTNWRNKWNAIRWGGGTQIMPGWEALVETYLTEFGDLPKQDRPHLLALVITDGEADDTTAFAKTLDQTKAGTYVCVAVLGFGGEHDAALAAYQQVAASNDHVRVVTFGSETDPSVIADGVLSLIGS